MRSIGRLFSAASTLADSLLDQASVVGTVTGRLRQQFALDEAPPALPHGENIDGNTESGSSSSVKRNSRAKATS